MKSRPAARRNRARGNPVVAMARADHLRDVWAGGRFRGDQAITHLHTVPLEERFQELLGPGSRGPDDQPCLFQSRVQQRTDVQWVASRDQHALLASGEPDQYGVI